MPAGNAVLAGSTVRPPAAEEVQRAVLLLLLLLLLPGDKLLPMFVAVQLR
jgi:hypothetical protein